MTKILLLILALPKSIYFNFKYLSFKNAIRLPILVSHRVWLLDTSGRLFLDKPRTACVRIGFGEVGIFDKRKSRSVWQCTGEVRFKGRAHIGHGSKISVSGTVEFGDSFEISAESAIASKKKKKFGDNVLVSWDVLIIDSDFHAIYARTGARLNEDAQVKIGNNVWIGCRSLVMKGVDIPDGVVVGAGSVVNKSLAHSDSIFAGSPAVLVRSDIVWKK